MVSMSNVPPSAKLVSMHVDPIFAATFNEDATVHQGNKQNYKAIKLYAIIAEPNGTLDIARKTHTEHVEDIAKRM
jgi:hypothetical protein